MLDAGSTETGPQVTLLSHDTHFNRKTIMMAKYLCLDLPANTMWGDREILFFYSIVVCYWHAFTLFEISFLYFPVVQFRSLELEYSIGND